MSLEICVLASGSSGNCTVVRSPGGVVLVDCGIGPRIVEARLRGTGLCVADVSAICLTHLDRDHFNLNWLPVILDRGIRVHCSEGQLPMLLEIVEQPEFARLVDAFDVEWFEIHSGLSGQATRLAHDQEGSSAFVFEGFGGRVGHATDLGHVPMHLVERFCGVDLLAIESNYDPTMQMSSLRPWFLKQRIMGGRGHLSNEQALSAVQAICDRCQRVGRRLPQHIVLLHRSRQCNCPRLVRSLFERDARIAPRLVLSEQNRRTDWLKATAGVAVGEQLSLGWG